MTFSDYPFIAILGPTGSGKSRLGMELARRFQGEIISCDALQIYRQMDIGTAKPTPEERAQVVHHMLDLRDPGEDFSAGDYQRLGREALSAVRGREHLPFVVGGTGFYFRALTDGLFDGPGHSEALRSRMRQIIERRGARCLHRALQRVDSDAAARIMPGDASRTIRAYEVYLLTGKTMSWWQNRPRGALLGFRPVKLGIAWPREVLYRRINERVEKMFRTGLVEEVQKLLERYPRKCHAFKAIGYRQIADHLEGRLRLEEASENTQRESRRYAKRQLTWFRADPEVIWLDGTLGWEELISQASQHVSQFADRTG